jgi:hypothetical protein
MMIEDANGVLVGDFAGVTSRHHRFVTVLRGLPAPVAAYVELGTGRVRAHRTILYSEAEDFSPPLFSPAENAGFLVENVVVPDPEYHWKSHLDRSQRQGELVATEFYTHVPGSPARTIRARSHRSYEMKPGQYGPTELVLQAVEVMPVALVSGGRFTAPLRIVAK